MQMSNGTGVTTMRQTVTTFPRRRDKKSVQFTSWGTNTLPSSRGPHPSEVGYEEPAELVKLKLKSELGTDSKFQTMDHTRIQMQLSVQQERRLIDQERRKIAS